MNNLTVTACELCDSAGEEPLWQDELRRVVPAECRDYPDSVWCETRRPGVSRVVDRDALRSGLRKQLRAVAQ